MCMHSARCSDSLARERQASASGASLGGRPARTRTVNTATSHDALALRRDRGDTLGRTPRSRSAAALPDRYRRRRPATRPAALRLALTDDPITEMAQRLGGRDAAARRMSTLEARATAHRFATNASSRGLKYPRAVGGRDTHGLPARSGSAAASMARPPWPRPGSGRPRTRHSPTSLRARWGTPSHHLVDTALHLHHCASAATL